MPQHPDPVVRRAVRVLAMLGQLHKRGYQRLRMMPSMASSGTYWRCSISSADHFYRNHGAMLVQNVAWTPENDQATAVVAVYSSGQDNHYFDWSDAEKDDAFSLADKFIRRFHKLAESATGWDYSYAGWYQRLLGVAEAGWLPIVLSDFNSLSFDHVFLTDVRPREWRTDGDRTPILPVPPPGELQSDYKDRFA